MDVDFSKVFPQNLRCILAHRQPLWMHAPEDFIADPVPSQRVIAALVIRILELLQRLDDGAHFVGLDLRSRRGRQVDELTEVVQPGIVSHHIGDRDVFFSVLSELRPVIADSVVVAESAFFVHFGDEQRREVLAGAEDIGQRISVERSARDFALSGAVALSFAEDVDDFLASEIDAELRTDIEASEEKRFKDMLDRLELGIDMTFDLYTHLSQHNINYYSIK